MTQPEKDDLVEALRKLLIETKWKSIDKDNMEFEARTTCFTLDYARAALAAIGRT